MKNYFLDIYSKILKKCSYGCSRCESFNLCNECNLEEGFYPLRNNTLDTSLSINNQEMSIL